MSTFKIGLLGLLFTYTLALESKCPSDNISKLVVCYYKSETSLINFNVCSCTHMIFTNGVRTENNTIFATEDSIKYLKTIKERKANLFAIFTLETVQNDVAIILKSENKSEQLINEIFRFLQDSSFNGIELNFKFNSDDGITKESYATFVKGLSKKLSSNHRRMKRESYDVSEKLQDDITTAAYTTQTPKNSTSKTQSIKRRNRKEKIKSRKIRENFEKNEKDADYLTLEESVNAEFSRKKSEKSSVLKNTEEKFLIFIRLAIEPEIIVKKFDLKTFSRYADYLIVPTHNIVNDDEHHMTYHPSRLIGLIDILNTDSILDLMTGMGVLKSKIVISLPATVLKFQLKDENKNTPRSPSLLKPQIIDQLQLCSLFSKNNWTVERDEDLTAPYAFSGKTWLAFEDEISVNIKGKYILLRELAGGAIYSIDADLNDGSCTNHTGSGGYLTGILHKNFESLERKPRSLVLETLQQEIHDISYSNVEGGVKTSEYRIVRIVDNSGAVHVIRKNTKTQFECSRQGYFSHPLGCNKFYRCVKFDQYSDEFTVFEYDCPAGLAFDERWEVCVWPGSLPHGAPCTGSSEIAPVPRSHYQCPNHEGYFADPENCRWFFACLDHARNGITPLTAYEFRCPFGLVFSERKLACDWPWLVGSCGNQAAGIHLATFINGGNLETSFGQFANSDASLIDFGKKFGDTLNSKKVSYTLGSYEGAQSAGFGYIASQFDDNHNKESFAAFPDYEVSGGRIFNKGGVVLNQNVAGISGSNTGRIKESLGGITGASSLNEKAGHNSQRIISFVDKIQSSSKFQNFEPLLETPKTKTLGISEIFSEGHLLHQHHRQNFLSTPKPISVSIPSVEINNDEIFKHSQHFQRSGFESKTHFNGEQYSISRGLPINQPAVSVTVPVPVPTVTSTPGILTSKNLKSSLYLKTPIVPFYSTPKPEFYNSEQIKNQSKLLNTFFANHPPISIEVPKLFDVSLGTQTVNTLASLSMATSKPGIQSTRYTASGFDAEINQSFLPKESLNQGKNNIFVGISQKMPSVQVQDFKSTNEEKNIVSENINVDLSDVAVTPSIFISTSKTETNPGVLPEVSLRPGIINLAHSSIDQKVSNELRLLKPHNSYEVSTTAPQTIHVVSEMTSNEYSNRPAAEISVVTPKTDFKIFSHVGSHSQSGAGRSKVEVPIVTPQPNTFNYYSSRGAASFDYLGVTPVINNLEPLKTFTKQYSDVSPAVPETNNHSAEQAVFYKQKETSRGKIFHGVPPAASEIKTGNIVQGNFRTFVTPKPEVKFSHVISPSQLTFDHVYSYSSSTQRSGNHFDSVKSFSSVPGDIEKTNTFAPEVKQADILTEFAIEKQPVVSVGSISSTSTDLSLSTPEHFTPNVFSKSFKIDEFKSVSSQPENTALTTPAPVVSIIPSSRAIYVSTEQTPNSGVYYTSKSSQPVTVKQLDDANIETFSSPHQETLFHLQENAVFGQKSKAKQEVKPFVPVSHVTSIPSTYKKENTQRAGNGFFFDTQSSGYLSTVTPKTEIFETTVQQNSKKPIDQFVITERNPVLVYNEQLTPVINHQFDFIKTKPLTEEKGLQHNQRRISIPISTPLQEPQQRVLVEQYLSPATSNSKPFKSREEVVEVEILKSIELNPSQFFQINNENVLPNHSLPSLVIQQQPLHLLSHKTFPLKQIIQPFFNQEEQKNIYFPENNFDKQFKFPQQKEVEEQKKNILQQRQYLSPPVASQPELSAVTFSTAKTVSFEQPSVYSMENNKIAPPLPVFDTSQSSQASPVDTTISSIKTNAYAKNSGKIFLVESNDKPQPHDLFSSKVNLLIPTSTELPQPSLIQSEEFSIQNHRNFDSQKINTFSSAPPINVFIQSKTYSTSKPGVNTFETPALAFQYNKIQNLTTESSRFRFDSNGKYAFNSSIEVPEPAIQYLFSQKGFTTPVSGLSSTSKATGQFQFMPTESIKSGFKGSTYLPPSNQNQNSKMNLISLSNLGETDIGNDNIKHFFDKNSKTFGHVVRGKNERFVPKVNNENADGNPKIIKEGQYEVNTTTLRQKSRERQYYGGITSSLKATSKYEEYDIKEKKESQSSFDFNEGGKDSNVSKTIIDLKNLNVNNNKKTVIMVSRVSDANPILIGKLAGQCSCQSNMIELRNKNKKTQSRSRGRNNNLQNQQRHPAIFNEFLPPYESNQAKVEIQRLTQSEASTPAPKTVVIDGSKADLNDKFSYLTEQNLVLSSTTNEPELISSTFQSSLGPDTVLSITPKTELNEEKKRIKQFRGKARFFLPSPLPSKSSLESLLSAVPASEIANTYDFSILKEDESRIQKEINRGSADGISKPSGGAAFDRYGPGGWRSFDETLQGSLDCKRPGLFRHPKYCNKFYACNYDPWKERYTLHVFNCPIHLTYDSSISACNWPVRGPACADDNLLI